MSEKKDDNYMITQSAQYLPDYVFFEGHEFLEENTHSWRNTDGHK